VSDDLQTHDLLTRAVGQEPPFVADVASVVSRGESLRHRRRVTRGSSLAVGACAVLGAAFVIVPSLGSSPAGQPTTAVGPGAGGSATPASPPASTPSGSTSDPDVVRISSAPQPASVLAVDAAMAAAIRASSPSNFTLVLPAGDASSGGIEGTADDGAGKGRISAGLSLGGQQVHPCLDPEFKAGSTCTERVLADGAVLSSRGLVTAPNGVTTYEVVITYPNGYGVNLEAGNFTMGPIPPTIRKQDIPTLIHVQRPTPTYSLAQLETVAIAVNAATH
jgi:hypothetical protein